MLFQINFTHEKVEVLLFNQVFITNILSTHYKDFYLISCSHDQRSHFTAYVIMSYEP